MRLQQKYFTGYSQEGFFDPLKNAFTKVKDKFSLNLDLNKTKPDALEKEMLKTYLNDDWLHRRKWVSPQSKIMLQHGTLIKVPAGKEKILSDISSVYEETKNFAKFFNQQFAHEREFKNHTILQKCFLKTLKNPPERRWISYIGLCNMLIDSELLFKPHLGIFEQQNLLSVNVKLDSGLEVWH